MPARKFCNGVAWQVLFTILPPNAQRRPLLLLNVTAPLLLLMLRLTNPWFNAYSAPNLKMWLRCVYERVSSTRYVSLVVRVPVAPPSVVMFEIVIVGNPHICDPETRPN